MQYIRRYLKGKTYQEELETLSLNAGEIKHKRLTLTTWESGHFFVQRGKPIPLAQDTNSLLKFLTKLFFDDNLEYSSLNTARSAVSQALSLNEMTLLGNHPLITQSMKGVFYVKTQITKNISYLGYRNWGKNSRKTGNQPRTCCGINYLIR